MLDYFSNDDDNFFVAKEDQELQRRKHRLALPGFTKEHAASYQPLVAYRFSVGDVLRVTITKGVEGLSFLGICLGIRKTSFKSADCSIILRNVLSGIGIELIFSHFYNRAYRVRFEDHQRKLFFYYKSKLFFLRHRTNQFTRSKE